MIQELVSVLNNDGYDVKEVIPDGQMHRFNMDAKDKKKSGFYTAYQNHSVKGGGTFYIVVYGSWRGDETKTYCTLQGGKMTREDKKIVNDNIDKAKKKAEKERQEIQEEASKNVTNIINKLPDSGNSDYLKRKLVKPFNVKFHGSSIVIPVKDVDGKVWSAQTIFSDGKKQFYPNGKILGGFHTIGNPALSDIIYITEGYATGATIHEATNSCVIVSFTASNLIAVSKSIREIYSDKSIVICADDDRDAKNSQGELYNIGVEKANEAAKNINATVAIPIFTNPEKGQTDFNDLHYVEGMDTVRKQLRSVSLKKKMAVYPLGHASSSYFLTSTNNNLIECFSALSETDLLKLMPLEYWEMVFPTPSGKVDWMSAKSKLMEQCRQKGIFEYKMVRGSGVWLDQGRVVVNMGDHLVVDGKRHGIRDIRSKYFYTLGPSIPPLPSPLTADECQPILNSAHLFKWKSDDHGFLLAGAMVIMRVCGALPIRPHIWVTGERGSGKSTLFNRFTDPLMGRQAVKAMGTSTEAGIRQTVNSNAFPVMFDEFESNGVKSQDSIQSLIDLMRVAWSETNAVIYKGSANGNSQQFQARFSALVVSIRQAGLSDADRSRFATVELAPHESDAKHWQELDAALHLITDEMGDRLFSRTVKLMPVLIENYKILKKTLNGTMSGQRFADQYGMLLAGYSLLLQDEVIDEGQAKFMVDKIRLEDEREESNGLDHEAALEHLLTTKVSVRYSNKETGSLLSYEAGVGELIETIRNSNFEPKDCINTLLTLGIKVNVDSIEVVTSSHAEQQRAIWKGSNWSKSWRNPLLRIDGAKSTRPYIGQKQMRSIMIPFTSIFK